MITKDTTVRYCSECPMNSCVDNGMFRFDKCDLGAKTLSKEGPPPADCPLRKAPFTATLTLAPLPTLAWAVASAKPPQRRRLRPSRSPFVERMDENGLASDWDYWDESDLTDDF